MGVVERLAGVRKLTVAEAIVEHVVVFSDGETEVLLRGPVEWSFEGGHLILASGRWLRMLAKAPGGGGGSGRR